MTTFSELRKRLTAGKYQPNGTPALAVVILAELLDLLEREREETAERFAQPLAPEPPRDAQPERLPAEPVIGRDGQPMIWTVLSNEAAVAGYAWERFSAFMSREDYEALTQDQRTLVGAHESLVAIERALVRAGSPSPGNLAERIDALVREHGRKLEAEHDATHAAGLRAEQAEARAATADTSVAVAHDALSEAGVERFTTALGQGGPSRRALTLAERVRLLSSKIGDVSAGEAFAREQAEAEVVRLRAEVADVRKDRDNACHRVDVLEDELREAHEARRSLAHAVDRLREEARSELSRRSRPANRNDPDHD